MKTLLIISHGSRRPAANEEVFALADRLREQAGSDLGRVSCAFSEIADPNVPSAIDELAASGATEILVFPYFLAAGAHVATDVPREVAEAETRHPEITFSLLPHLGALPSIPTLILGQLEYE